MGKRVPLHRLQFRFHRASQLVFEGIKGQFVLGRQITSDVLLHRIDALGDGLLAESAFSAEIGTEALFLAEACLCVDRLVQCRRTGRCKL